MAKFRYIPIILLITVTISAQTTKMIQAVTSKTATIIALDEDSQPLSFGSGFLVGTRGEIATNYHVIQEASSVLVKFPNSNESIKATSIIHKDSENDLAVILVPFSTVPVLQGDDELSQVGEKIMAIGNPEGLTGTVSDGIISGFRKLSDKTRMMQITAPISPGSSGGPVINSDGEVIAIATAQLMTGQNLNFAIPIKKLKELMAKERLQLSFGKRSLPKYKSKLGVDEQTNRSFVRLINIGTKSFNRRFVNFSIQNNSRRDIKNVKILFIWFDGEEKVHHYGKLVSETIPSSQAKYIDTYVPDSPDRSLKITHRILDYEILETSGLIEFR